MRLSVAQLDGVKAKAWLPHRSCGLSGLERHSHTRAGLAAALAPSSQRASQQGGAREGPPKRTLGIAAGIRYHHSMASSPLSCLPSPAGTPEPSDGEETRK